MSTKVFARNSTQGYWGAYYLENFTEGEYEFEFVPWVNIKREYDSIGKHNSVMFIDLPLSHGDVGGIEEIFYEFFSMPFLFLDHFANSGVDIEVEGLNYSKVDSKVSIVGLLHEHMRKAEKVKEGSRQEINTLLQAMNGFLQGSFDDKTRDHVLLADFFQEDLYKVGEVGERLREEILGDVSTIEWLRGRRDQYVNMKIDQARALVTDDNTVIVFVEASRHVYEIRRHYLEVFNSQEVPIILFVLHPTRGDDLYTVYTGNGISAMEVAKKLGSREGNDKEAKVFLPNSRDLIQEKIKNELNRR